MSDGALSQAEIDALMGSTSSRSSNNNSKSTNTTKFGTIVNKYAPKNSTILSSMIGDTVDLRIAEVSIVNHDDFLDRLQGKVVYYNCSFPGYGQNNHFFIFVDEVAIAVAGKIMGQTIIDMTDAAVTALGEAVSDMNGNVATSLTAEKKGDFTPEPVSGNAGFISGISFPGNEFVVVKYEGQVNGLSSTQIYEVFSTSIVNKFTEEKQSSLDSDNFRLDDLISNTSKDNNMGSFDPKAGLGVQPVQFSNLSGNIEVGEQSNIGLLMDVSMELTVELGRTKRLIKDILGMGEGTIIELDKLAGEPVDILVNHKLIAKGEVVVIDENFGVRVTEIISPMERVQDML